MAQSDRSQPLSGIITPQSATQWHSHTAVSHSMTQSHRSQPLSDTIIPHNQPRNGTVTPHSQPRSGTVTSHSRNQSVTQSQRTVSHSVAQSATQWHTHPLNGTINQSVTQSQPQSQLHEAKQTKISDWRQAYAPHPQLARRTNGRTRKLRR